MDSKVNFYGRSKIIPDIAVWLLTLQTVMEMSEEGARE